MEAYDTVITETEWGLHAALKKGASVDNSNILPRMGFLAELCKKLGKQKIFLNVGAATRNVPVYKLLEVVDLLKQKGTPGLKVAFLAPHLVQDKDSRFVENASHNRGVYIHYFAHEEVAMKWLLEDDYICPEER